MTESGAPAVVIGGGVVGLACAAELARRGWWVLVLEKEPTYGRGTSSRNSEVIHAGIYYEQGSLKARFCVEGRDRLYRYLAENDLPYRRCGKLIVATDAAEIPVLEGLAAKAAANGVTDLRWVDGAEARRMEPDVASVAALESPSTGILDVHALMHALAADVQAHGGDFVSRAEFTRAEREDGVWQVGVRDADGEEGVLEAAVVVNAAGLHADEVARCAAPLAEADVPLQQWVKGRYFSVRPSERVRASRLIYPCPHPELRGLGVHLTLDLAGGMRLGPDVQVLAERVEDYDVDAGQAQAFYESARRFLPGLQADDVAPAYAGLRPQRAVASGFRDFYIAHESGRGAPGWINLIGIESPGLTAALAIAEYVADLAHEAR
jgi:L-2-hydroxyglutarate oxidase LhgO